MKKKVNPILLVFLFLTAVLLPAQTQEKPLITVLPFSAVEVSPSVSLIISQLFETNLVNTGAFEVLSQNERDQILAAQSDSLQGCSDEACAIEIGRLLSAEQLIMGTVAALGTKYIITAKIIDVTTSRTLGAENISAASVEELDVACHELTLRLVRRSLPELAQTIREEPVSSAGAAETDTAPPVTEPPLAEGPGEAVEPPDEEEKPETEKKPLFRLPRFGTASSRQPGAFSLPGYALHTGSLLLGGAGTLLNMMAVTRRIDAMDAWAEYITAGEDTASGFYTVYDDNQESYKALSIASWSFWGAGLAAAGGTWFFTDGLSLSFWGRVTYAAGLLFCLEANIFTILASNQALTTLNSWQDYISADSDPQNLYNLYQNDQGTLSIFRIWALSTLGIGTVLQSGAPFIPGEKHPLAPSLVNRILFTSGALFLSAGNLMSSAAFNTRSSLEEEFDAYMAAEGSTAAALYEESYQSLHEKYRGQSLLAYGLWALGGTVSLVSLFVPFGSGDPVAALPFDFTVVPVSGGVGAVFHYSYK